jgi:hypothetical protein
MEAAVPRPGSLPRDHLRILIHRRGTEHTKTAHFDGLERLAETEMKSPAVSEFAALHPWGG